jgi:cobaltochelatase CobN
MHLLAATPGTITDGSTAVDLGQSPGDIVLLSAADSELAAFAAARNKLGAGFPTLRLANLLRLGHNLSVDLYVENVITRAKLVVVRLLGGTGYWPYGIERIAAACRATEIKFAVLPGDDQPDPTLAGIGNLSADASHRLWQYCVQGGAENALNGLRYAASLIGHDDPWAEPTPLLRAGLYWPGRDRPSLTDLRRDWLPGGAVVALIFYRALVQAGDVAPIDALIAALRARGLNPLPVYVTSLKDPVSAEVVASCFAEAGPSVVLNAVGFAVSSPGGARHATPFDAADCPVLQVVLSGGALQAWRDSSRGLSASDLAMNVALPEVDGRILSRAVSFKAEARFDALTECPIVTHAVVPDRVQFVAELAARWVRLRQTSAAERRVAIVLANYPTKDGRIGNGVGLDTPAGTVELLRALQDNGYAVDGVTADGEALMARLLTGPTNARGVRLGGVRYPLAAYRCYFAALPAAVQTAVTGRWGTPEADPFVAGDGFVLSLHSFGNAVIGVQPSRGYNIDPAKTYHDPDLVPPHGYLAFYAWLRTHFDAHAIVHMGKHGNLEWLPGKAVALSEACFPEAVFGAMPHLYPFIVNDPGEGTQAKRRAGAVIIDHLTPPLTRAESYGALAELEQLVDEFYEAAGVDPRRLKLLSGQIIALARRIGLDRDCGIEANDEEDSALAKLDNYLCELKEMQIRDGLHIFGRSPEGVQETDLLVALTRLPRRQGEGGDASLIRALAADLGLGDFDPLDCRFGDPWTGPRPAVLGGESAWRTCGDTVERLELLARDLVIGTRSAEPDWQRTKAVLDKIETEIRPAVLACGAHEIAGVLTGLDGRFVMPGPSGAPTRGRLDVLPTGRNFYSVDSRTVPTPAAWQLGWKSAELLLQRHRQEQGAWPRALALSAWGTANMRTGGDDIAQALALMGVRPVWEPASRRVTGFEIMPLALLDRPRIDVTLRVSGFFRDAFPGQIDLVDSAVRAVAALDEPAALNPLAARVKADAEALIDRGVDPTTAERRAAHRVFGSKPGAYGAGLQALIDERGWEGEADLARAYLAWGGYAYGGGAEGRAEHRLFETRLAGIDAVLHNQDNREHDLLDSDDYYQFEGGLAVAVRHLSGQAPVVYHNDHSRPETPKVRTLGEEVARVVRARVVNPKWIAGVMRHGYKGAFEMAATVDYLFAFAATTHAVTDQHFDAVFDAYLGDEEVLAFMRAHNPAAVKEIAERLAEAVERELWRPSSNAAYARLKELSDAPRREAVA